MKTTVAPAGATALPKTCEVDAIGKKLAQIHAVYDQLDEINARSGEKLKPIVFDLDHDMELIDQWGQSLQAQLEWRRAKSFKGAMVHLLMAQERIYDSLQNKCSEEQARANLQYARRQLFAAFAVFLRLVDSLSEREAELYERYFPPNLDDYVTAKERLDVEIGDLHKKYETGP